MTERRTTGSGFSEALLASLIRSVGAMARNASASSYGSHRVVDDIRRFVRLDRSLARHGHPAFNGPGPGSRLGEEQERGDKQRGKCWGCGTGARYVGIAELLGGGEIEVDSLAVVGALEVPDRSHVPSQGPPC